MPIHIRLSHHDRLAVIVAHGTITADDIHDAVKQFWDTGAVHYRKLVDVAAANSNATFDRLKEVLLLVRNAPNAAERGPLAFVVDSKRGDTVRELVGLTEEGERPVGVFTNLHAARKWLDEVGSIKLRR